MDDGIGKVNPINTGKDSLSIRAEHTTTSKPKVRRPADKTRFEDVLQKKEAQVTDEEKKKKEQPHGKYKNGKRIL